MQMPSHRWNKPNLAQKKVRGDHGLTTELSTMICCRNPNITIMSFNNYINNDYIFNYTNQSL